MKQVSGFLLRINGWKIKVPDEYKLTKAVVIMAPHTSMSDFWIGRLAFWYLKMKVCFLIKKEMFFFPIAPILKAMGGIPVDRKNSGTLREDIVNMFVERKSFVLTITPEGTRKLNHHWKKGFYYIALKADVPVLLGYLDYKSKTGGIGKIVKPTGNFAADMKEIELFYHHISAKYPENFNLSRMHREKSQQETPS